MTQKLDYYISLKDKLIGADTQRDKAFRAYADIYHCTWKLPAGLEKLDWLRMEISTDPHDAISAGVRVMTSIPPKIKIIPLAPDKENKRLANEKERVLGWALHCANRRRPVSVEADVMLSALLTSAVAMNVVDLDWQIELARANEADTRRLDAARRYGRFVVNTYNPTDVHVLRSSYGPELVLLAQERLASEVMYEWGGRAKKLKQQADNGDRVMYFSAMDYTDHCVWVEGMGNVEIVRQSHDLPFLNWVALMGGSTLEQKEEYKYHPILFPVLYSGQWDTKNVLRSLNYSDVIARSGAPRYVVNANDVNNPPVVNFGDIGRPIVVGPGESVQQLQPPEIDAAALQVEDRLEADMARSTVSPVLTGGEVAAGMSFAALNLQTLTATGALKPAKELAEKALAEMFKLMCQWAYHTGMPIEASGTTWNEKGLKFTGEQLTMEADDDSLPDLNILVELKPDLPTDQLQRINAASIAINNGIISKEEAMENIGITDPEAMTRQIIKEQILQHKIDMKFQEDQMALEQEAQAQQMETEMQAQQAQQAQMGPQQPQPLDAGAMPPTGQPGSPMQEMMQGPGFNPNMGGMPPAMLNPSMTREMQTGSDMGGNPLAGGMG